MSKLKGKDPAAVEPGKCKGLIFGASGVGKTWFSLAFPKPFYFDTEGGADLKHYQERLAAAGGVYMGPADGTLDFNVLIEQMQALATEKHEYKTLIIDSITKIFQTCISNESERLKENDVFGASKKPAISKMRRLVNWCERLDMNVWFIAHEVSEWGKNPTNGQREEIGKTPDVWDKLVYELDLGLRVIRRGKEYPPVAVIHKSRLQGFPLGETFSLDYDTFSNRYGKDYIEAITKTIVLATPEQIAEITRLVEIQKLPDEQIEKILTKAGAENFAELKTDQAADTITWLNKRITGGK